VGTQTMHFASPKILIGKGRIDGSNSLNDDNYTIFNTLRNSQISEKLEQSPSEKVLPNKQRLNSDDFFIKN